MGGKEDIPIEPVPDPEAEEVGVRGAGVVELVGEDMNGKAGRESQTPSPPNPEEGDQPEDEGQFIGVQEEKVLPIFVAMRGLEKSIYTDAAEAETVKVLEEMIQIDEDPGEEKSARGRQRAGEEIDQTRTEDGNNTVVVELNLEPA